MSLVGELRSRLQYKIILPFLLLTLIVALAGSAGSFLLIAGSAQERLDNQLVQVALTIGDALANQERANLVFLREISFAGPNDRLGAPAVADAFDSEDSAGLAQALDPYFRVGQQRAGVRADRLIAFSTSRRSLIDWELARDISGTTSWVKHAPRDLSALWFVPQILGRQQDELGDKFAGLLDLADSDTHYLFTAIPVLKGDQVVGGLIIAMRLDTVLQTLSASAQVAIVTLYRAEDGGAFASTAAPAGGLAALNMRSELVERTRDLKLAEQQSIFDTVRVNGRDYQFIYAPLRVRDNLIGLVSVGLARDYVTGPLTNAAPPLAALTIGLMLAIIGLGIFIARQITRPLQELVDTAQAVTAGDLERRSRVMVRDEIGILSHSFNDMTAHLLDLYRVVHAEASQRAAIVESITEGVIVCDLTGGVLVVNRAMRELLSLTDGQVGPQRFDDLPLQPLSTDMFEAGATPTSGLFTLLDRTIRVSVAPVIGEDELRLGDVYVLHDLTHQVEDVRQTLISALARAGCAETLAELSEYTTPVLRGAVFFLIAPPLATALADLDTIAGIARGYLAATSGVSRHNALQQMGEQLDAMAGRVGELREPFGPAIWQAITRWRELVNSAFGERSGVASDAPIRNPYVFGNPVEGSLFLGREDVMRRLEEVLGGAQQSSSVILYGHRRMGKSSILRNLGSRFGPRTVIVDFNMQRIGRVKTTGELLFSLALKLYDAWYDRGHRDLAEPDEAAFLNYSPYLAFDRFLDQLRRVRGDHRFIITIDEFELIEQQINEDRVESALLEHWRSTFQTYPWLIMIFTGLHTLEEMRQDYWSPLFGSVTAIEVSFLQHEAAWRLVTQPTTDFVIDYDADVVEQIIALTNGQPYLMQLIGHNLVTRLNRQIYEEGASRDRRFTIEDLEAVINAPEFYRDGNAYFNGVWVQAATCQPDGQTAILEALSEGPVSLTEIASATNLSLDRVRAALYTLQHHDVIIQRDGLHGYAVELMRRWVAQQQLE